MTVLPVIARELRSSARHAFTYYLRAAGAGLLLVACLAFGMESGFGAAQGGRLFNNLHSTLFWAIWLLVPLMTADCISGERREGTLGLLFLTPLNGADIVVAKGLAHGLRALTIWLAVLPVVAIPFLLGGMSWDQAVLSVMINLSAICWSLAAGLLASAWSRQWVRALMRALLFGVLFLMLLATGIGWLFLTSANPGWAGGLENSWFYATFSGLGLLTNARDVWDNFGRLSSGSQLLWTMIGTAAVSVLVLTFSILAAGSKTRRVWQEQARSPRQIWWEQTFCTPFLWLSFFHRWMRRKLQRNPIGWLEQRTWSGRLVTWGWFAVVISLYSAALTDRHFFRSYNAMQNVMAWLMAGSLAMSAAGSFRRERESGVLELLLVSPLGESEIIAGRLRGLWGQFLPAFCLLLLVWSYLSTVFSSAGGLNPVLFYATTFLALPIIGLYFSLLCRNFVTSFLATLIAGLLAPLILPSTFLWLAAFFVRDIAYLASWQARGSAPAASFQLVIALLCWSRLVRRLKERNFPMQRIEP